MLSTSLFLVALDDVLYCLSFFLGKTGGAGVMVDVLLSLGVNLANFFGDALDTLQISLICSCSGQAVGKLQSLAIFSFVIRCLPIFIFLILAFRATRVLSRTLAVVFEFVGEGLFTIFFAVCLFDIGQRVSFRQTVALMMRGVIVDFINIIGYSLNLMDCLLEDFVVSWVFSIATDSHCLLGDFMKTALKFVLLLLIDVTSFTRFFNFMVELFAKFILTRLCRIFDGILDKFLNQVLQLLGRPFRLMFKFYSFFLTRLLFMCLFDSLLNLCDLLLDLVQFGFFGSHLLLGLVVLFLNL